jgi:hypothetical protein
MCVDTAQSGSMQHLQSATIGDGSDHFPQKSGASSQMVLVHVLHGHIEKMDANVVYTASTW